MFQKKGQIVIERQDNIDKDELMMQVLDAGAEDFDAQEEVFEITTTSEEFCTVRESLEESGIDFLSAEITMIPDTKAAVENDDDGQDVYHNVYYKRI